MQLAIAASPSASASQQGGLGVTSEALRAGVPVITSGILCLGGLDGGVGLVGDAGSVKCLEWIGLIG